MAFAIEPDAGLRRRGVFPSDSLSILRSRMARKAGSGAILRRIWPAFALGWKRDRPCSESETPPPLRAKALCVCLAATPQRIARLTPASNISDRVSAFPSTSPRSSRRSHSGRESMADTVVSPQTKWRKANPKAVWAQHSLRSAVRRGLIAPQPCEVCGAEHADAHHDDYDRPMAVRWLCRLHHRQAHRKVGGCADGEG